MTKENEAKEAHTAKSVIKDMIARNEKAIEELATKKKILLNPHDRFSAPDSYLFNPPPSISPAADFELGLYDPKKKEDTVEKEVETAPKVDSIEFPPIKHPTNIDLPASNVRDTFIAYESYIEELKKRLMDSLDNKTEEATGDLTIPAKCVEDLQAIIGRFNNELNDWYKNTGCTATFGWSYNTYKTLELLGIDFFVYRKPPPSETTLSQVLKKHAPNK